MSSDRVRVVGAPRRLATVIVCYRAPERTTLAARALAAQTRSVDRLYVVDNGGRDEAALRAALPRATVLTTPRNLGFAGGANVGLRAALGDGADAVLLVNDDAHLADDAVSWLDAALDEPRAGIVGPALLDADHRGTIESLGLRLDARTGRLRELERGRPLRAAGATRRDVQAVSGCVALIAREVLERVGLLDEGFFFYFEDVDLCLRAGRAGFRVLAEPRAVALHRRGSSVGQRSARRLYHAVRGHLRLGRKLEGERALTRQAAIVGWNLAHVLLRRGAHEPGALAQVLRGVADHVRGRPHEA